VDGRIFGVGLLASSVGCLEVGRDDDARCAAAGAVSSANESCVGGICAPLPTWNGSLDAMRRCGAGGEGVSASVNSGTSVCVRAPGLFVRRDATVVGGAVGDSAAGVDAALAVGAAPAPFGLLTKDEICADDFVAAALRVAGVIAA